MGTDALLTTEQLAEKLQVPIATLYQWRYRGSGPAACRIGKHLRYRLTDVEAWIERQYGSPRPAA